MVRTKAGSISTKAVGAKAPQKVAITAILSGNAPKSRNHSGGNPYHPRETPGWQKPITFFMKQEGESSKDISKEEEEEEEEEEKQGIPGISATKSLNKKFKADDSMEVEEAEMAEIEKNKGNEEKEPEGIREEHKANKNDDKVQELEKDEPKKIEDPEEKEDDGKDEDNIRDKDETKTEQKQESNESD